MVSVEALTKLSSDNAQVLFWSISDNGEYIVNRWSQLVTVWRMHLAIPETRAHRHMHMPGLHAVRFMLSPVLFHSCYLNKFDTPSHFPYDILNTLMWNNSYFHFYFNISLNINEHPRDALVTAIQLHETSSGRLCMHLQIGTSFRLHVHKCFTCMSKLFTGTTHHSVLIWAGSTSLADVNHQDIHVSLVNGRICPTSVSHLHSVNVYVKINDSI